MNQLRLSLQQLSAQNGSAKDLLERYKELLNTVLSVDDQQAKVEQLKVFIESVVNENVGLVISRQLLSEISSLIVQLPVELSKDLAQFCLERIQPRAVSFEDQVATIRRNLADVYESEKQYRAAAEILVLFLYLLFLTSYI